MRRLPVLVSFLMLAVFCCGRHDSWTTESGLQVTEVHQGTGAVPKQGEIISLHYTGWYLDGDQFDTTAQLEGPRKFRFGKDELLPGLEEGVATMRKGGKRILILPPHLAFGEEGRPGVVPPMTWVKFEVELVDIEPAPLQPIPWNEAGREIIATKSGLQIVDFAVGTGEFPELGSTVVVHYSGFLEDGTVFDSTIFRRNPVEFQVDAEKLIPGWVEGLLSMREGGMRKLIIPPFLGYGEKGFGKKVPPNSTLIYDIQLLEVR
ncbi:MAG: FKBP-type peptidyl-prolyl cis-trans isomerase [Candidatus Latescibacterota bacterium]|nr:MAG: FKBP-type peptidyl-prolyl cis-trans isomerase [Candidatus Latescibacterota bacterium]